MTLFIIHSYLAEKLASLANSLLVFDFFFFSFLAFSLLFLQIFLKAGLVFLLAKERSNVLFTNYKDSLLSLA